jgi:putative addiction module component (TIGR02574 family)
MSTQTQMERLALELLALPTKSRAELAHRLIRSLDDEHSPDAEEEWLQVAKRRAAELAEGKVEGIPAEEVSRRLKDRVG